MPTGFREKCLTRGLLEDPSIYPLLRTLVPEPESSNRGVYGPLGYPTSPRSGAAKTTQTAGSHILVPRAKTRRIPETLVFLLLWSLGPLQVLVPQGAHRQQRLPCFLRGRQGFHALPWPWCSARQQRAPLNRTDSVIEGHSMTTWTRYDWTSCRVAMLVAASRALTVEVQKKTGLDLQVSADLSGKPRKAGSCIRIALRCPCCSRG